MRRSRTLTVSAVAVVAVGLAVSAVPAAASSGAQDSRALPARAASQIEALAAAKHARTPAQQKVSTQLLVAAAQRNGGTIASGVGRLTTGVTVAKGGTVHVTVTAARGASTADVAKQVLALHGFVRATGKTTVDADLQLSAVSALAGSADVSHIAPADRAELEDAAPTRATPVAASTLNDVTPATGSVDSEGDRTLAADVARSKFKVGGTGVTVGVLSDGVDSLADSIASGELPADTRVLDGQAGSGDEGTAMLEIVHDVAPKADLMFATAFTSAESFADNIRALRAAGADIIVDDVLYYAEDPFQDGPIAQAVRDVTADGASYFSSAGNEGNVDDGTSGNYEGDFVSSGQHIGKFAGVAHDFAPGNLVQASDPVSSDSGGDVLTLFWADPLGGAADDYDLYVIDAGGNVVAVSNDTQNGDDNPYEVLQIPSGSGLSVAVVKYAGAKRYFQVSNFRGRFENNGTLTGYVTPGITRGHSAVTAAFSVAAVPAHEPLDFHIKPGLANPSGPYPSTYTRSQQTEVFTSDGPRRVFFQADGTPITPGNFSSTGGEVRNKPDLTSADGVMTSVAGFAPFFGTSAAAPHAAAVAALVLSGNHGMSPAKLRTALTTTALDIEQHGYDRDTGYGIATANRVLNFTGATSQPLVTAGEPTVTPQGDGDAYLEPGESAQVSVPLTNAGDATATSVSVRLSADDGTVTPAQRLVGSVKVGQTKATVFTLTVPASHRVGHPVHVTVSVRFLGALSPTSHQFSVPVGQPAPPKRFRYTGDPIPIPDDDATGVDIPLHVTGVGLLSSVTFSIDGADCSSAATVGISHTYDGDLIGTLVAPDGTSVTLFSRVGSSGDNFCRTVFDDSAAKPIGSGTAPFTGRFRPDQPLAQLQSRNGNGTWVFNVSDNAAVDTGSVLAFSLHLSGYAAG